MRSMASIKRSLMDVWPQEGHERVFLCLENSKTGTLNWVFKGCASAGATLDPLMEAPIKDMVKAGPISYVYMEERMANLYLQHQTDKGVQLSLFQT